MWRAHLGKDTVYNAICQRVVAISQQVLFTDVEVMIRVKLPKLHHTETAEPRLHCHANSPFRVRRRKAFKARRMPTTCCTITWAGETYLAVYYIEVLIREVAEDFVDVVLLI